ncbi:MAG: hypothetical protein Q8S43_09115 [Actinomycetota bacterium]|nr:MAG: hypothetical protein FD171_1706 [Actinomycetota bacterium]MDO8949258.1 hypothetical protein [Actinomycetota bacterium]MDP3631089.1 hypothetical protein [Actinomycetota bacterium]
MITDYELHGILSGFAQALVLVQMCLMAVSRNQKGPTSIRPWLAWGLHDLRARGAFLLGASVMIPIVTVVGLQFEASIDLSIILGGALMSGCFLTLMRGIQELQYKSLRKAVKS